MTSGLTPAQEWWTAEEIAAAALPDLPASKRRVNALSERLDWRGAPAFARRREGKGGGWEYSWRLFPSRAQRKLLAAVTVAVQPDKPARDEAWTWFEALPQSVKDKAQARLLIIQQVDALAPSLGRYLAVGQVAGLSNVGDRTIWSWFSMIVGVRADDRLVYLAPRNRAAADRKRAKDCSIEFFNTLKSLYLRLSAPCFTDCYRDACRIAAPQGWQTLPERTMRRHLDANVSRMTQVLAREGVAALKRLYPPQVRDKSALSAMEVVNADGHIFDVFVEWPAPAGQNTPGKIIRPVLSAFQDIYSGRILSWRIDQTVNSTAVQLAAGDMIETYGIPEHVLFDNGREYAAKALTGGAPTRFRFKVKEDDPQGLFVALGCQIHWATPYHGQAKPIERAFRDMCHSIAKDVRFDGAYTGNKVTAKPEDYGSKAIPLAYFLTVLTERIAEHNTRQGRKSPVAFDRSFVEIFDESYAQDRIKKATQAQRRLWLMGAEGLTAKKASGAIWFEKNEFWTDWMMGIAGQRVIVRFDKDDYTLGLHVYSADNAYLGHAPIRQAVGFLNAEEGRVITRARNDFTKAEKAMLKAHKAYEAVQLGAMMDAVAPVAITPVEAKVVKPIFGKGPGALRKAASAQTDTHDLANQQAIIVADIAAWREAKPAVEETERERFRRALDLERAGPAITREQARWLAVYQTSSEYRSEKALWEDFGDAIFG